jgi:four helix bundle protein
LTVDKKQLTIVRLFRRGGSVHPVAIENSQIMGAGSFRDLLVYKKAFDVAMDIYEISKKFPAEEKYSLTDQIRRSSRAVTVCIGEAYRKRQYPAHFASKSSDADMENTETRVWLDFAQACKHLSDAQWEDFDSRTAEIGKLLNHMIDHPENYSRK